jgi:hypothetical protein
MSFNNLSFVKAIPFKSLIFWILLALCLLSVPVAAIVEYVDCSVNHSSAQNPLQLSISQTAAVDNLLIAQINFDGGTINKPDESWILLDRRDALSVSQALYYKHVQDPSPSTYMWTFETISFTPMEIGTISEFSGVDWTTGPIFGYQNASGGNVAQIYLTIPEIPAVPAGSRLVAYYSTAYPRTFPYLPYPGAMNLMCKYTYPSTAESTPSLAAYNESWSTTGNTGSRTLNIQSSSWWVGHLVALRPVGGCTAPSITTQPMNVTACVGSPVTFSVCATGTEPLSYQWQKNGADIPLAIARNLVIDPVTTTEWGDYTVNVSNSCGYVVSSTATLTVKTAPSITTQPTNVTAYVGSPVTFSVCATGTEPLSYRWQKNGVEIQGAMGSTYTIPSLKMSDGGSYTVNVSNGCGYRNSNAAILTVNKANTATTLTSSMNPSVYSQLSPTFTATVIAVAPGAGTPTGTVTFKRGTTTLGTGTLSGGSATFTPSTTALAVGTHSIIVVYPGDANFIGSTSPVFTQTVNPPPKITAYVPNNGKRGTASFKFVISGSAFQNGATVSLTKTGVPVIDATGVTVSAQKNSIICSLKIPSSAPTGMRNVTVKNPDGGTVTVSGFTVR